MDKKIEASAVAIIHAVRNIIREEIAIAIAPIREDIKILNDRIDNLVAKNNLKE